MAYYHRTAIYLTETQKKIISQFLPQKMSSMVRDIIDVIINSNMINPNDYNDNPEILALIYNYRKELVLSNATYLKREKVREKLYEFFESEHIPLICAQRGHKFAIKTARGYIQKFRETHPELYLSDRVSENMILDYIYMIENTGIDDAAWQTYQHSESYQTMYERPRIQ